jgi:hypothetical protein
MMMTQAAGCSEMLVLIYHTRHHHIPENSILKACKILLFYLLINNVHDTALGTKMALKQLSGVSETIIN